MNIKEINQRHLLKADMYYRAGQGLSSELLAIKNGIVFLRVVVNNRWQKSYQETALEIATCWKENHPELEQTFGCKVFIVDARKSPYKKDLLNLNVKVDYDTSLGLIYGEEKLN